MIGGEIGPRPLWSLWDVLRLYADKFVGIEGWLKQMQMIYLNPLPIGSSGPAPSPLADESLALLRERVGRAKDLATEINLTGTTRTLDRLLTAIGDPADHKRHMIVNFATDIAHLLGEVAQRLQEELEEHHFVMLDNNKSAVLLHVDDDWAPSIKKFRSAEYDIKNGVDCYACEHDTACVFHMMRVAEIGLRALSREREVSFPDKPIEWAQWEELIDKIDAGGKAVANALAKGPERDAARAFYRGAVGQFHSFKDRYRNVVMHVRKRYDSPAALRSINEVRDFMNGLSAKIGEKTRGPIQRWS
jgi:hypothetical protein